MNLNIAQWPENLLKHSFSIHLQPNRPCTHWIKASVKHSTPVHRPKTPIPSAQLLTAMLARFSFFLPFLLLLNSVSVFAADCYDFSFTPAWLDVQALNRLKDQLCATNSADQSNGVCQYQKKCTVEGEIAGLKFGQTQFKSKVTLTRSYINTNGKKGFSHCNVSGFSIT